MENYYKRMAKLVGGFEFFTSVELSYSSGSTKIIDCAAGDSSIERMCLLSRMEGSSFL